MGPLASDTTLDLNITLRNENPHPPPPCLAVLVFPWLPTAPSSQNINFSSLKLMARNEVRPPEGAWLWRLARGRSSGAAVAAVGLTEGLLGRSVISWSCSVAHSPAGLGRAASLSGYLHANRCYLIPHPSVARFHNFKNWRGRAPPVALSWQFDSDFIIRPCFYNKQELSCLIRHARQRPLASPPPPPPIHSPSPSPFLVRREGPSCRPVWLLSPDTWDLTRYLPPDRKQGGKLSCCV